MPLSEDDKRWRIAAADRLLICIPTLLITFTLILLDAAGAIDVGKFGYAWFGGIIGGIVTFYIRKNPSKTNNHEGTGK